MIENKQEVKLIQNLSDCNKMVLKISDSMESKIKYLCTNIHNTEWSGVLFYTVTGKFGTSMKFNIVDILPMDIGNSSATSFSENPDIVSYMCEHPELLECYQGLIHSHHSMETFFSITDINTLKSEGKDRNHFLSLIINNKGVYNAMVTRHVSSIKNIKEYTKYNTYSNEQVSGSRSYTENDDYIEYFKVEVKGNTNSELLDKIKELENSKKVEVHTYPNYTPNYGFYDNYSPVVSKPSEVPQFNSNPNPKRRIVDMSKEDTPFTIEEEFDTIKDDIDKIFLTEDKKSSILHGLKQIVTGSALLKKSCKIDLKTWLLDMDKFYDSRFEFYDYDDFIDPFMQFIVEDLRERIGVGQDIIAKQMIKNINSVMPISNNMNMYVAIIVENLMLYI